MASNCAIAAPTRKGIPNHPAERLFRDISVRQRSPLTLGSFQFSSEQADCREQVGLTVLPLSRERRLILQLTDRSAPLGSCSGLLRRARGWDFEVRQILTTKNLSIYRCRGNWWCFPLARFTYIELLPSRS